MKDETERVDQVFSPVQFAWNAVERQRSTRRGREREKPGTCHKPRNGSGEPRWRQDRGRPESAIGWCEEPETAWGEKRKKMRMGRRRGRRRRIRVCQLPVVLLSGKSVYNTIALANSPRIECQSFSCAVTMMQVYCKRAVSATYRGENQLLPLIKKEDSMGKRKAVCSWVELRFTTQLHLQGLRERERDF